MSAGDPAAIHPAPDTCEVCARPVAAEEARRAELSVDGRMCPTPMTFHPDCYEQAAAVWSPGDDTMCGYDPEFPETGQWPSPTDFE